MEMTNEKLNRLDKFNQDIFSHLVDWMDVADINSFLSVNKNIRQKMLKLMPTLNEQGFPHEANSVFKLLRYINLQVRQMTAKKINLEELRTRKSCWEMLEKLAVENYQQLSNAFLKIYIAPQGNDDKLKKEIIHLLQIFRMANMKFSGAIKHHLTKKRPYWQSVLEQVAAEKKRLLKVCRLPADYSDLHELLDSIKMMPPQNYARLDAFFFGNSMRVLKSAGLLLCSVPPAIIGEIFYLTPPKGALEHILFFSIFCLVLLLSLMGIVAIFANEIDAWWFKKRSKLSYKDYDIFYLVPDHKRMYKKLFFKYKPYMEEYKLEKNVTTINDLVKMLESILQKLPPVADAEFALASKLFNSIERWLNNKQSYERDNLVRLRSNIMFWHRQTQEEYELRELYQANEWRLKK